MMRPQYRAKAAIGLLLPVALSALLMWQLHSNKQVLQLRNNFLLETLSSQSEWVWDSLGVSASGKEVSLQPGLPPLVVHLFWCVDGHFELSHYISVLSVLHFLKPDSIVIHYRVLPRRDPKGYWTWLEDLQRDVVFLTLQPLVDPKVCGSYVSPGDLEDLWGVFLLGNVAVSNLSRSDIVSRVKSMKPDTPESISKRQVFILGRSEPYNHPKGVVIQCPTLIEYNTGKSQAECVDINSYFFPEDLMHRDTAFFRMARHIMYGSTDAVQVKESGDVIPNTVHVILAKGGTITPLLYLSIKSAFVKFGARNVFVHGPEEPQGALWRSLDKFAPTYIPTAPWEKYSARWGPTVYALYTLLQRGGTVHYGDIVFLKPLLYNKVPAVASVHRSKYRMQHRLVNTNLLAATSGSQFVESLLATLRQKLGHEATVDHVATHINEQQPATLSLDNQLTTHMTCDLSSCHVSGGHFPVTTELTSVRLLFSGSEPSSLEGLRSVGGAASAVITQVLDVTSSP